MIRNALTLTLAIGVLAAGAAPAVAKRSSDTANASLGALVCQPATNALSRMIEVTATMRPIPGAERMELRFVLLQRLPGYAFAPVHGGDLGRWLPEPPVTGQGPVTAWIVRKPVVNLYAPAAYRFRVTFRWLGPSSVIARSIRDSPICEQPGWDAASDPAEF